MARRERLARIWLAAWFAALAALALAAGWLARAGPLAPALVVRVDALSAFFALLAALGGLLLSLAEPIGRRIDGGTLVAVMLLFLAFGLPYILAAPIGFALLALVLAGARAAGQDLPRRLVQMAPELLAAACLLAGYGLLARGAARYDDPAAGAALGSLPFWLVLLAAVLPIAGLAYRAPPEPSVGLLRARLFAPAWLYPLLRLYSLGPWNTGWSLAALLLGGGLALWCALGGLALPRASARAARSTAGWLALALVGAGLATSAGVAAAGFAALSYLVIALGAPQHWRPEPASSVASTRPLGEGAIPKGLEVAHEAIAVRSAPVAQTSHTNPATPTPNSRAANALAPWLLAGPLPFSAPFVAAWLLMGACMAGGVAIVAGAAWLALLLSGCAMALWGAPAAEARTRLAGWLSLALGLAAPLLVRGLLAPVAAQLQGGLTPYGDVNIWPWVGLAAADAANRPVTTWPSVVAVLLLLVVGALVYTLARLRAEVELPPVPSLGAPPTSPREALAQLRAEVPWLGLLLAPDPPAEEPACDAE